MKQYGDGATNIYGTVPNSLQAGKVIEAKVVLLGDSGVGKSSIA